MTVTTAKTPPIKPTTPDEYIAAFEPGVRERLVELRALISEAAPGAEEHISYGLPAFKLHGWLIYYSAAKNHLAISFPSYQIFKDLAAELDGHDVGKTSVRFPLDQPLPSRLIKTVVEYRIAENIRNETKKAKTVEKKTK
jgi:uncharacterized protein YdhG (YjbR/CyaY superfamily)